jgi:hypothetical protein
MEVVFLWSDRGGMRGKSWTKIGTVQTPKNAPPILSFFEVFLREDRQGEKQMAAG